MTIQSDYGNVLIGRFSPEDGGPEAYFPRYFDKGTEPRLRSREKKVAVFRGVNVQVHGDDIGRLCEEASEDLKGNSQIADLALVGRLGKILTKRKCS